MIPFIPSNLPIVQGPAPTPAEPDPDGYPKRSLCVHCGDCIELAAEGGVWTVGNLLGGRDYECPQAPNPDDGPMPGHTPGAILSPPKRTCRCGGSFDGLRGGIGCNENGDSRG